MAPFAPHITEEIWKLSGNSGSVTQAQFPEYDNMYLIENKIVYPIAINGKRRSEIEVASNSSIEEVEKLALEDEITIKWLEGKKPGKIIVVPNRMVNIVI